MAKPRNYHALNAIQRKAGFHSGKRKPDMEERDSILEQMNEEDTLLCDSDFCSVLPFPHRVTSSCPGQHRGEQWISGFGFVCDYCSGEFEL